MGSKSVRTRLLAASVSTVAVLAGLAAAPASAQDAPGPALSEIVVTGSRLPRPNLDQPTPIAVLHIENAPPLALGDLIAQLPQAGYAGTLRANSNNFGNGAGISSIDLRGLGVSRTLVLVDGQRHVAGDLTTNAVDVNSIPPALVDRVEVITGGASAIYGSDAVSGVVNIITKKRFEGLAVDAQMGGYSEGFGAKYNASMTAGRDFLDDRLNVAVSGFWRKERGIGASDLPGAHNYGLIVNPADVGPGGSPVPNDGIPDRLYAPNVGSEFTTRNGTLVNISTLRPIMFDAAGNPVATPQRTGSNSLAYGQLPANCANCFFPEDFEQISSPIETKGFALNANMDFSAHLHGFVDAKFVQNDVENDVQPSVSAISAAYLLRPDNAFLTPAIAAALDPGSLYLISKFLNDGRSQDIRRRTWRVVAGLNGDFDAGFAAVKWDGALNYGETDTRIVDRNLMITQNFFAALDSVIDPATGKAACRINVPSAPQTGLGAGALNPSGCVPYNPFGQLNSAAAMAYSFGDFGIHDLLTQQVANLNATFDTSRFLELPGGPIGVATGVEYRMERTRERNDPMLTAGETENVATDSSGGYNVYEAYLELNAPVLKHAGPMLDELSFDAAWRGAHYSTVGSVSTYKLSSVYGPAPWLKFRGTYSQAIRAPNITEGFQPLSGAVFSGVKDPCDSTQINTNINYAANCAAAGLPPGFTSLSNLSIQGTASGNPDLKPETSISYTAGFVLQPPMIPNLAVTLDYYSIKIKDAITEVQAQDVVDNCYGSSGGLDQTYCSLLMRDARQQLSFISTTYVNAAKLFTDGWELQVSYAADVAPLTSRWRYTEGLTGRLSFNLTADYLMRLRNFPFQQNPGDVNIIEGTASTSFGANPQLKGIAQLDYRQGPTTVRWTTRYIGKMALFSRDPSAADHSESLNIPFTEPTFYHDVAVRYRMGGEMQGTELSAGIQNLFDERPPFTVIGVAQGTGQGLAFDLGRFMYVGVHYRR
ncbi:MAG TPA: TonB-dependent receptor [Phenylobacterium sp.]|uniref:TonB-dependent receptor domain-containing protein n=1 Tax=Phenylobacterium sp. TaxID=1871053 RepID=UPI002B485464|nr:TonB-dependent receptor [Phenylobacterium sp.]HKR87808.1 TonB-dependent receptor [Phenylobacterium sp.]